MKYAEFNETRNALNELQEFKKPLTKVFEKLVYCSNLGIKYQEDFEYYFINTDNTLISKGFEDKVGENIEKELEKTFLKLAYILEKKESNLKNKLLCSTNKKL